MPGIIGIISAKPINAALLADMIAPLRREKFHKIDKFSNRYFACARVHLNIFNPEHQPIFNENKSLCIFLDGKIYGYDAQLIELKKRGHKFNIENDAEFCLHSYEEYGKDFVKQLNGSFVLLIYDLKKKKVLIANDRFGFRVHYYAINNNSLLFAPEAKAILQDKTFKKELSDEATAEYFAFGEFWGIKTLFKGINILTPASILTYDGNNLTVEKYWEFKYVPDYAKSENEFVNELVEAFKNAIDIRMRDNLRYGATLSGGLDSRSVLATMSLKRKDVAAFTHGAVDCDEAKIAKQVTEKLGVKEHVIQEIFPESITNNAEREMWLTDGRCYIGVSFANPASKILREKVNVLFDGFALDLMLGGSYLSRAKMNCRNENILAKKLCQKRIFQAGELCKLFKADYYDKIKELPDKSFDLEFNKITSNSLSNKSDEFALNTHVAWMHTGDIPYREAFEVAHPTADNKFVDIICKLPPKLRYNHRIYRKFLKKLSPEMAKIAYHNTMLKASTPVILWNVAHMYLAGKEIAKQKLCKLTKGRIYLPNKRSYVNFNEWFRSNKNWQFFFKEILSDENDKYFNQDYVKQLFQEQISGQKDNSRKLLYLASFKVFLKLFNF
jgi:asparagine synthase (glutamine-hydrolysing)